MYKDYQVSKQMHLHANKFVPQPSKSQYAATYEPWENHGYLSDMIVEQL